ncbi:MAG: hypothetical protein KGJ07_02500 [Patescibacteria group bacterium]|nr:hypothetical protein [Patescibacteria group bacterium]
MKKSKFSIKSLTKQQRTLRKRILEISHASRFSHLGSCFSAIDAIDSVYQVKKPGDLFVLSNGHAGVAYYTVLEAYGLIPDKKITQTLGVHPDRNPKIGIHVSTGSLGQGLPIALGMAIGLPKHRIFCMLSDGECAEGSIWEAVRVATEKKIINLPMIVIANGWGAYDAIDTRLLAKRFAAFGCMITPVDGHNQKKIIAALRKKTKKVHVVFAKTTVEQFSFLNALDAHYYVMKDADYQKALKQLL